MWNLSGFFYTYLYTYNTKMRPKTLTKIALTHRRFWVISWKMNKAF